MSVKVFCSKCGKEIWKGLTNPDKMGEYNKEITKLQIQNTTLYDCMNAICSDCLLKDIIDDKEKEKS